MPIDLYGCVFKKTSNWAAGSPILSNILGSSLFVAITIALIMIVLIMIMYPAKTGTPFSVVGKMFVYMLFSTLLIIFLHDGVLKCIHEEKRESDESENFMQNTTREGREDDPAYGSTYKLINPSPVSSQSGLTNPPAGPSNTTVSPPDSTNAKPAVTGGTVDELYDNVVLGGGRRLYGPKPIPRKPNLFQ